MQKSVHVTQKSHYLVGRGSNPLKSAFWTYVGDWVGLCQKLSDNFQIHNHFKCHFSTHLVQPRIWSRIFRHIWLPDVQLHRLSHIHVLAVIALTAGTTGYL